MNAEKVSIGSAQVAWPVLAACIAAAPLLGVVGMRFLAHGHPPASANAVDDNVSHAVFSPPAPVVLTPEARQLRATYDAALREGFGSSPMINRAPPVVVRAPDPIAETPVAPVIKGPSGPPALSLTSIMSSRGQPIAVINGKLRHIGDHVGNGYAIVSIDSVSGQVEIANDAHDQATLQLKGRRPE